MSAAAIVSRVIRVFMDDLLFEGYQMRDGRSRSILMPVDRSGRWRHRLRARRPAQPGSPFEDLYSGEAVTGGLDANEGSVRLVLKQQRPALAARPAEELASFVFDRKRVAVESRRDDGVEVVARGDEGRLESKARSRSAPRLRRMSSGSWDA